MPILSNFNFFINNKLNNTAYKNNQLNKLSSSKEMLTNVKTQSTDSVSFKGISHAHSLDKNYRKQLALGLSEYTGKFIHPELLKSVLGVNELKHVLAHVLKPENYFNGGIELTNVKNGIFRANLHSHSVNSDGESQVSRILDQAAKYTAKTGSEFFYSLTDHDEIEGCKQALAIIADNPKKYEKVRFSPGIEFSAKFGYTNSVPIEILGYSINPFDEKINIHLSTIKHSNNNYAQKLIEGVNKIIQKHHPTIAEDKLCSLQEASKPYEYVYVRLGPGPLFNGRLKKYIMDKSPDAAKEDIVKYLREKHAKLRALYGTRSICYSTAEVSQIANIMKNNGIFGLAHPGRVVIKGKTTMEKLINHLKKLGATTVEGNYQYKADFISKYAEAAKNSGLLQTGGLDTHRNNIFYKTSLPEEKLSQILD